MENVYFTDILCSRPPEAVSPPALPHYIDSLVLLGEQETLVSSGGFCSEGPAATRPPEVISHPPPILAQARTVQ